MTARPGSQCASAAAAMSLPGYCTTASHDAQTAQTHGQSARTSCTVRQETASFTLTHTGSQCSASTPQQVLLLIPPFCRKIIIFILKAPGCLSNFGAPFHTMLRGVRCTYSKTGRNLRNVTALKNAGAVSGWGLVNTLSVLDW